MDMQVLQSCSSDNRWRPSIRWLNWETVEAMHSSTSGRFENNNWNPSTVDFKHIPRHSNWNPRQLVSPSSLSHGPFSWTPFQYPSWLYLCYIPSINIHPANRSRPRVECACHGHLCSCWIKEAQECYSTWWQWQHNGHVCPLVVSTVSVGGHWRSFSFPGTSCTLLPTTSTITEEHAMISMLIGIVFYLSTALIDQVRRSTHWLPDDINHGN